MASLVLSSDNSAMILGNRMSRSSSVSANTIVDLERVVRWYLETAYGRWEGPGTTPFYSDPARVGRFAVDLDALAAREPAAMFRLLVTLASYQSRRDVDIMQIQCSMPSRAVAAMTSLRRLKVLTETGACPHLRDSATFDRCCDVRRDFERGGTTCGTRPRTRCHVKDATAAIGRMGDLGKMPTSAWLHLGPSGFRRWLDEAISSLKDPHERAVNMVERVSGIFRIGVKLASMFVTALCVPELGGVAPFSPMLDGSRLVVIDANVARAIRIWRDGRSSKTYEANARWLIAAATQLDLSRLHSGLRPCSPRLVQQAVYVFRSYSNRKAQGDGCATKPCSSCPSRICPFRATSTTRSPR